MWVNSNSAVLECLRLAVFRHHNQDVTLWRPLIALLSIYDVKVFRNDLMYRGQGASRQPRLCHQTILHNCQHIDQPLWFPCAGTTNIYNNKPYHLYYYSFPGNYLSFCLPFVMINGHKFHFNCSTFFCQLHMLWNRLSWLAPALQGYILPSCRG
jgi:hypothetical protein